jgi:threonine synthase
LQVISEEYSFDNVTVTVAWTQQAVAMYDVRIVPLAPNVSTGNVNRQLTLSYNTVYNLSVVAVTPCGNATAFIGLHYGKALSSTV